MSEPAEEETNAGGEEAGAETTVEPGEEVRWNTGNMLQTYSQGNHESNDEISLEAEGPDIMAYSRDGNFRPYGRPEEAIDSKEVYRLDPAHFRKVVAW